MNTFCKYFVFALLCLFMTSCIFSEDEYNNDHFYQYPSKVSNARGRLIHCDKFSSNRIYYGAEISSTAIAFSIVYNFAQIHGSEIFEDVLINSFHPEGQAYALVGLYWTNKQKYQEVFKNVSIDTLEVIWYCEAFKTTYHEFIEPQLENINFRDQLIVSPVPILIVYDSSGFHQENICYNDLSELVETLQKSQVTNIMFESKLQMSIPEIERLYETLKKANIDLQGLKIPHDYSQD